MDFQECGGITGNDPRKNPLTPGIEPFSNISIHERSHNLIIMSCKLISNFHEAKWPNKVKNAVNCCSWCQGQRERGYCLAAGSLLFQAWILTNSSRTIFIFIQLEWGWTGQRPLTDRGWSYKQGLVVTKTSLLQLDKIYLLKEEQKASWIKHE